MLVVVFLVWTTLQLIHITLAAPGTFPLSSKNLGSRSLSTSVPECANPCVQGFVQESFPTSICPDQQDLDCLCTNQGLEGFTLGEGLLQCVVSNCVYATAIQYQQAYTICDNVPGAISPTHATISASMKIPTTIVVPTAVPTTFSISTIPNSISRIGSVSPSAGTSSGTPSTVSSFPTSTASALPSSSSFSSRTGSASAANAGSTLYNSPAPYSPVISKSTIIGISVGLAVLALIAMALLAYLCCVRRRKSRESAQSWGTHQPLMTYHENQDGYLTSPGMPQVNPYIPAKAQSVLGQHYPMWSPIGSPQRDLGGVHNVGLAISPRVHDDAYPTPASATTYHTTSRLLPDKPSMQVPPPRPPRDGTEGLLLSAASTGGTRKSPSNTKPSPDSFNSGPIVRKEPSDPFLRVPEPLYSPPKSTASTRASRMKLPKLDTRSSQISVGQNQFQPPAAAYNPADYVRFAESQIYDRYSQTQEQPRSTSLPGLALTTNVAASNVPRESDYRPVPPPKEAPVFDKFKPIPPPKRRPAASTVTSFETDDEEDERRRISQIPPVPPLSVTKHLTRKDSLGYSRTQLQGRTQQVKKQPTPPPPPPMPASTTENPSPISQIRYPTVPSLTQSPLSRQSVSQPVSAVTPNPYRTLQYQIKQQDPSQLDVSPITPQVRRKDNFVLPQQDRLPAGSASTTARFQAPVAAVSSPSNQNSWRVIREIAENSYGNGSSSNPIDASRLINHGYAELPERGSSIRWSPAGPGIPIHLEEDHQSSSKYTFNNRVAAAPNLQSHLAAPIPPIAELPSPDAERLIDFDPLSRAGQALSTSPKNDSRGARLGRAVNSRSLKARPRKGSLTGQERASPRPLQQQYHEEVHPALRSPRKDHNLQARAQAQAVTSPTRPSAARSPISRDLTGGSGVDVNENIRGTAKWTVLCSPGQL